MSHDKDSDESKVNLFPVSVINGPDLITKDKWFHETEALWPGQRFGLKVENVLFHQKSKFQDVMFFQSSTFGKVLVLDGVIQVTERDECAYQEMITHLPLFSHPNPKNVCIVGGGDGGVLREVAKHSCVEKIDMCEIDELVVEQSKLFFADSLASSYDDPRLRLIIDDAAKFINSPESNTYDVIIVDSSDPVGPAEVLFQPTFFQHMATKLNPGGIIITQGECIWLHLDLISRVVEGCAKVFPSVEYAYTAIPSYPSGQIGFIFLSNSEINPKTPYRRPDIEMQNKMNFYNPELHSASFCLPQFASLQIRDAKMKGIKSMKSDSKSSLQP